MANPSDRDTREDADDDADADIGAVEPEAIELPIDGTLDLHTFRPREVKELLPDYIAECLARGIHELRVVHGKGTGTLRKLVHSLLSRDARVASYRLADESAGGWGATLVVLRRP